jgi:hypothetical protein
MHLRILAILFLALALVAGGCGGDGESADSDTDVDQLLQDTFAGGKSIESGRISLALDIASEGGTASEPLTVKVSGPFQTQGASRLPLLDIDASLEGGGQSMAGGLTTTADQAFVTIGGTAYEIAGPVYEQFKAGYEQAANDSSSQKDQSLASLGLDPRRWLTNARNEGEAKVGDTDTIKITGDVDVPKLLDDVNGALGKVRSLGVQGADQIPDELTDAEKRQAAEAIDELSVEIYTGADDRILRRMVVTMGLTAPEGSTRGAQSVDIKFDLQLQEVNEDQEIEAPENARSFEELLEQLEGLGIGDLSQLGISLGAGGGGSGASEADVGEYSECVQQAGSDNAKVRKCADLLISP